MDRSQLLKGTTTLLVLGVLRDGELYGYEIAQRIRERSGARDQPGRGLAVSGAASTRGAGPARGDVARRRARSAPTLLPDHRPRACDALDDQTREWETFAQSVRLVTGAATVQWLTANATSTKSAGACPSATTRRRILDELRQHIDDTIDELGRRRRRPACGRHGRGRPAGTGRQLAPRPRPAPAGTAPTPSRHRRPPARRRHPPRRITCGRARVAARGLRRRRGDGRPRRPAADDRHRRQRDGRLHRRRHRAGEGRRRVGPDHRAEHTRRQPRRDPADRVVDPRGAAAGDRLGRAAGRSGGERGHVHHPRRETRAHGARHEHRCRVAGRQRRRRHRRHARREGQERRHREHPLDRRDPRPQRRLGREHGRRREVVARQRGGRGRRGRRDRGDRRRGARLRQRAPGHGQGRRRPSTSRARRSANSA